MICDQRRENLHHGMQPMAGVHIMSSRKEEVDVSGAIASERWPCC